MEKKTTMYLYGRLLYISMHQYRIYSFILDLLLPGLLVYTLCTSPAELEELLINSHFFGQGFFLPISGLFFFELE